MKKPPQAGHSPSAPEHSLLFRWTDPQLRGDRPPVRVMLIQDLTGLITTRREKRDATFGQLREIYDGRLAKSTGMGEDLVWQGYLGLLGAVTPTYDDVAELHSILGERFVLYRPARPDASEEARKALARGQAANSWRAEVASTAAEMVRAAESWWPKVSVPPALMERIIDLAQVTAAGRAAVPRDGYSKIIRMLPEAEGPARLAQQFKKLLQGLCAVRFLEAPGEPELSVIAKVARDTMPKVRLVLLEALYQEGGTTANIASRTGLPPSSCHYHLEDFRALHVAARRPRWELTSNYRALIDRAGFFGGSTANHEM